VLNLFTFCQGFVSIKENKLMLNLQLKKYFHC